jgi:hypothetical protein
MHRAVLDKESVLSKKLLIFLIVGCFCLNASVLMAQSTEPQKTKQTKHAQKTKKLIFKSGVGPGNDVEITLRDKTKLKGYLSEIADDYFLVTDPMSGVSTRLEYEQVEKVRLWLVVKNQLKRDFGSPGRAIKNVGLGIGITFGAIALICVVSQRCIN